MVVGLELEDLDRAWQVGPRRAGGWLTSHPRPGDPCPHLWRLGTLLPPLAPPPVLPGPVSRQGAFGALLTAQGPHLAFILQGEDSHLAAQALPFTLPPDMPAGTRPPPMWRWDRVALFLFSHIVVVMT